jgi:hypothetical protein
VGRRLNRRAKTQGDKSRVEEDGADEREAE